MSVTNKHVSKQTKTYHLTTTWELEILFPVSAAVPSYLCWTHGWTVAVSDDWLSTLRTV